MTKPYVIVVGVDYSDTANVALDKAFDLASKEKQAEVHVVNAVQFYGEYAQLSMPDGPVFQMPLDEALGRLDAHVSGRLAAWQERTQATFSRCVSHLSIEYPAVAVAQLASDLEADLIVVGTHGRRGFKHFMMGSVAEGVVRLAHSPVLVVRAPEEKKASVPAIEPPCPRCVETRRETGGQELWCEQHREKHGRRHTYSFRSRVGAETNFPLVTHGE